MKRGGLFKEKIYINYKYKIKAMEETCEQGSQELKLQ